jgi:hypothetical protein
MGQEILMLSLRSLTAATLIVFAACYARWNDADQFRSTLQCGATIDQVRSLATKFDADLATSDGSIAFGDYRIEKGNSLFWLFMRDGRLVSVREGQRTGLTEISAHAKHNLCDQTKAVVAMVHTPHEKLIGASVLVDGKEVGQISKHTQTAELELRVDEQYEVALRQNGRVLATKTLRFPPSPGDPRVEIVLPDVESNQP